MISYITFSKHRILLTRNSHIGTLFVKFQFKKSHLLNSGHIDDPVVEMLVDFGHVFDDESSVGVHGIACQRGHALVRVFREEIQSLKFTC